MEPSSRREHLAPQPAHPSSASRQHHTTDTRDANGRTGLHLAARRRQIDQLRAHVKNTRDVNATDDKGNRPLHLLFSFSGVGQDEVLTELAKILLDNGADIEAKNKDGKRPLHAAVACGSVGATKLLLNHGADPKSCNDRGLGALHYLAGCRVNAPVCADLLQLLLDVGCDINARSEQGRTPLFFAICADHDACFDLLMGRGANVMHRDLRFHTTLLHLAVKLIKIYPTVMLISMLTSGDECKKDAMINARLKDGRTALHLATRPGRISTLILLLRNGADVDSVDCYGRTALHYVCQRRNANGFYALLKYGADISAMDKKGMTAMMVNNDTEAMIWARVMRRNAKAMAAGLPVMDFRNNLEQTVKKMKNYETYRDEVKKLKSTMINPRVSVYDLLLDDNKMYKYRNNVVLAKIMLFNTIFPSYYEILIGKYKRAGSRGLFVRLASEALCEMTGYRLEDELNHTIFENLSNAKLHEVVEAAVRDD